MFTVTKPGVKPPTRQGRAAVKDEAKAGDGASRRLRPGSAGKDWNWGEDLPSAGQEFRGEAEEPPMAFAAKEGGVFQPLEHLQTPRSHGWETANPRITAGLRLHPRLSTGVVAAGPWRRGHGLDYFTKFGPFCC